MKTKEETKAKQKEWVENHKEEVKAYRAAWRIANIEKVKIRDAAYRASHKEEKAKRVAAWRVSNREQIAAQTARYRAAHKEEIKAYQEKNRKAHRELQSVRHHHRSIFNTEDKSHKSYKGMPFYDYWNPDKGGAFKTGEKWIIDNLGKRPEGCTLHIISHALGFTPGNLEWTHPRKQVNQQMYKIIAQQRNLIKKLEARIKELENQ
jgi:hypothetical protein